MKKFLPLTLLVAFLCSLTFAAGGQTAGGQTANDQTKESKATERAQAAAAVSYTHLTLPTICSV